jgi:hypothetical protein
MEGSDHTPVRRQRTRQRQALTPASAARRRLFQPAQPHQRGQVQGRNQQQQQQQQAAAAAEAAVAAAVAAAAAEVLGAEVPADLPLMEVRAWWVPVIWWVAG